MTTENITIIILGSGFLVSMWLGLSLLEKVFSLQVEVGNWKKSIKGLNENISRLEEENKALKLLTESPASESLKKQPVDPDFNPHPYSANFERFGDDELDEVSQMLKDHELREYGG